MQHISILTLFKLATKLDSEGEFDLADCCDSAMLEIVVDKNMSKDDISKSLDKVKKKLKENEKENFIDDGIFGINDSDNPTVKAAGIKRAGFEDSQITDKEHGLRILISTSARLSVRNSNPHLNLNNDQLNRYIGQLYSEGNILSYFKVNDEKQDEAGEVRASNGLTIAGIVGPNNIRLIGIRGKLHSLPDTNYNKGIRPRSLSEILKTK